MKKPTTIKGQRNNGDDLRPEYRLDYAKARPNRFAGRIDKHQLVVLIDADVCEVFSTPESVNTALRALIAAMPKPSKARKRA
ncbi:MAG: hypothetical protein JWM21_4885 [Acidobacteria bacterium]|nr:hypothetical protein [Acidobacteriota bacterium]